MEPLEIPPTSTSRPTRLTSAVVAGGAVIAMVLAGLGIASAQTEGAPPTTPPAVATEPAAGEKPADGAKPAGRKHHHRAHKAGLTAAATAIGIPENELRDQLRSGKTIAAVATEKGVAVDKVIAAMVEEAKTRIAQAVTDGKITQAQADARLARLSEHITAHVNRAKPAGHERGRGHHGRKAGITAAAAALGMTEDELRTELRNGKTIAVVATEKGVALDRVVAAMVDEAKARLATAVSEGKLTQEQADKISAELSDRITARVNRAGRAPAEATPATFDA